MHLTADKFSQNQNISPPPLKNIPVAPLQFACTSTFVYCVCVCWCTSVCFLFTAMQKMFTVEKHSLNITWGSIFSRISEFFRLEPRNAPEWLISLHPFLMLSPVLQSFSPLTTGSGRGSIKCPIVQRYPYNLILIKDKWNIVHL